MTEQGFRFRLRGEGWPGVSTDLKTMGMVLENMKQGIEELLLTQLKNNSGYRKSSPEYEKYLKRIPVVASLYAATFRLRAYHRLQQEGKDIVLSEPTDELFDKLGHEWLDVDQFDEALAAFTTCVEFSKREGPWWPQRLCARYSHLAFAEAILGKKQEQLRASLKGVAFAVAVKNSALDSDTASSSLVTYSFINLFLQISGCSTDMASLVSIFQHFVRNRIQAWEEHVAGRSRTLEEKLATGKQGVITDEDFVLSLADFLVHSNRDACRVMLEMLKSSLSSLSALEPNCGRLATREFRTLLEVCQLDPGNMTLDAEEAIQPRSVSRWVAFALELLEVATLEISSEYKAWSLSYVRSQFYAEGKGQPLYPCCCSWISIKEESAASSAAAVGQFNTHRIHRSVAYAEGGNHQELKDILMRVNSRTFDTIERGEVVEIAAAGRDIAAWASSSSTAAAAPFENIKSALLIVHDIVVGLGFGFQVHAAKSMLQDVVSWLVDQPNPKLRDICMEILLLYVQICSWIWDYEELVDCCRKALTVTKEYGLILMEFKLHACLGVAYSNMGKLTQAAEELVSARENITQMPEIAKDDILISKLQGFEGCLLLLEGRCWEQNKQRQMFYFSQAVEKLDTSLETLDKHYRSKDCEPEYHVIFSWITTSLTLSEALRWNGNIVKAQFICNEAFRAAREHKFDILAAEAAMACGKTAKLMGNLLSAERHFREGLHELDAHGCGYVEGYTVAKLRGGLGSTLLMQSDRLSEAEAELRQAVNVCCGVLVEKTLTSGFRINAFESLKDFFNDLQFCLYLMYKEVPESQKGIKAKEALIVAEQGRCRDFIFSIEERLLKSRDSDHSVDTLDWRKFDTDAEYAWEHLENCLTVCADAIKIQNQEVERVTFVEYTLTRQYMIVWVLHSHGTQEPSSPQATTAQVPAMFYVDIKDMYENVVTDALPDLLNDFEWIYGIKSAQSHYNTMLQREQANEALILLENQIVKLRAAAKPDDRQLNSLYKLLIRPFAKKLAKGEPVIFVPHEGLSFVPFAALKKDPTAKGKYLIQDHPIGVAYSLRTLGWAVNQYTALRRTSKMSSTNPMLLVSDPSPLGVNRVPLDDAIEEMKAIATGFPESSVVTLSRGQATLENVTSAMKSTSWFHIACHGEVCAEYPQGVLYLSCSGDSNPQCETSTSNPPSINCGLKCNSGGYLTPETIWNDVTCTRAHAAVLSACKVGLGQQTGEGLLGISRAFMLAGVPLVVAPLRTVDSRLCSAFMQRLYKKLAEGKSMMFALRLTMLDVITKNTDDEMEGNWQLWDWAAWLPVGFPGVCLPVCDKLEEPILELEQLTLDISRCDK